MHAVCMTITITSIQHQDTQWYSSKVFRDPGQRLQIRDCPGILEPMYLKCEVAKYSCSSSNEVLTNIVFTLSEKYEQ